jgi:8-oxo-dGTP diphosphatase
MSAKPFGLAVKAVVLDDRKRSLLIRRSAQNRHFVGEWEWPGGKVDAGEDFASAVAREAREETALDIEITGLAGATQFEMPKFHVVMLCLEARATGGEIKLSGEHDAFEWVPLVDFAKRPLVGLVRDFMLEYAREKGGHHG